MAGRVIKREKMHWEYLEKLIPFGKLIDAKQSPRRKNSLLGLWSGLEVIHKNVSDWFYKPGVTSPPYTKT
jgi:hypothetical protein